jgi:hypothetical protein
MMNIEVASHTFLFRLFFLYICDVHNRHMREFLTPGHLNEFFFAASELPKFFHMLQLDRVTTSTFIPVVTCLKIQLITPTTSELTFFLLNKRSRFFGCTTNHRCYQLVEKVSLGFINL